MSPESQNTLLASLVDQCETLCVQNAGMRYLLERYWPAEEKSWKILLGEHRRTPKLVDDVTRELEPARLAEPHTPLASDLGQFVQLLLEALRRIEKKHEKE